MINLLEEITSTLNQVSPDTYFHMLPKNPDRVKLFIVYEVNDSNSYDALDKNNYANDLDLTVKLLHPNPANLMQQGELVKNLLLNQPFLQSRDVRYRNSVPIFPDPDLKTNQYTLLFTIYKSN